MEMEMYINYYQSINKKYWSTFILEKKMFCIDKKNVTNLNIYADKHEEQQQLDHYREDNNMSMKDGSEKPI